MKRRLCTPLLFLFFLPLMAFASIKDQKEKMLDDLDIIKNTFEVMYAPVVWKKNYCKWDLEEQVNLAKKKIKNQKAPSVQDYQQIVKQFFNSTKDYHVGVEFYSTEVSLIPFSLKRAENKYFFTWIMEVDQEGIDPAVLSDEEIDLLSYFTFPFSVGDEIVEFDGKPIDQVIQEIKTREFGNPDSNTDQLLAESAFTFRLGVKGQMAAEGVVEVVFIKATTGERVRSSVKWIHVPEMIQNNAVTALEIKKEVEKKRSLSQNSYFSKKRNIPLYDQQRAAYRVLNKQYSHLFPLNKTSSSEDEEDEDDDQFMLLGSKKGPLPDLGESIWEAPQAGAFRAYIYPLGNKKIGYIRIPSFMGHEEKAKQFQKIISWFQEQTDALVIDQLNNPGGMDFYMFSIASALTDRPLQMHTEQLTITQKDVLNAFEFLEEVSEFTEEDLEEFTDDSILGYELSTNFLEGMVEHFSFIINEWKARRHLTCQTYLYGMKTLKPNSKVRYTKPIMILVNGLDFSCGDFFPAMMQDNKRATVFGSKTAGAGGYVLGTDYYNRFGIASYHLTGSFALRLNKQPIENLGITPDISYELTAKDLQAQYPDYIKAVNQEIGTILKK